MKAWSSSAPALQPMARVYGAPRRRTRTTGCPVPKSGSAASLDPATGHGEPGPSRRYGGALRSKTSPAPTVVTCNESWIDPSRKPGRCSGFRAHVLKSFMGTRAREPGENGLPRQGRDLAHRDGARDLVLSRGSAAVGGRGADISPLGSPLSVPGTPLPACRWRFPADGPAPGAGARLIGRPGRTPAAAQDREIVLDGRSLTVYIPF
jgi:hypothetical protein